MNILLNQPYPPSQAEDGKFVVIDPADLQALGYPVATGDNGPFGRYAVLTYNISPVSLSGASISVGAVSISNFTALLTASQATPLSTVVVGGGSSSLPSSIAIYSNNYTNSATVISPSPTLKSLEIYNYDENVEAYFMLSATSFESLTAMGIPIVSKSYYAIEHSITSFTVGASAGPTNLRIIGRY